MNEPAIPSHSSAEKVEVSVHLDSELLDQIKHLTNDPSKVIETAIRQWLRGDRREDELALTLRRNPPIPHAASGMIDTELMNRDGEDGEDGEDGGMGRMGRMGRMGGWGRWEDGENYLTPQTHAMRWHSLTVRV